MNAALDIAPEVGLKPACDALGVSRATLYRRRRPKVVRPTRTSWRALSAEERARVLRVLYDPRFVDASPGEVYATLLDEGVHIASESTMYRILRGERAVRERRAVRRHPVYARPELVATGPNQLWSWDITKIRGPDRRVWLHLYVILDVYSRKVVGWLLATTETAALAERFIRATHENESVLPGSLTLHSDRGTSMRSKTVAELLDDLGVVKSHSRPRVSNDNPFSEAQFKTLKYCPFFPGSFSSVEEGRTFFRLFFAWYNDEHHHSGIAMLTPSTVHSGLVDEALAARQIGLDAAYAAHPERFVAGPPVAARPPAEVWINRPTGQAAALQAPQPDAVAEASGQADPSPPTSQRK
jgi:putative transposase